MIVHVHPLINQQGGLITADHNGECFIEQAHGDSDGDCVTSPLVSLLLFLCMYGTLITIWLYFSVHGWMYFPACVCVCAPACVCSDGCWHVIVQQRKTFQSSWLVQQNNPTLYILVKYVSVGFFLLILLSHAFTGSDSL